MVKSRRMLHSSQSWALSSSFATDITRMSTLAFSCSFHWSGLWLNPERLWSHPLHWPSAECHTIGGVSLGLSWQMLTQPGLLTPTNPICFFMTSTLSVQWCFWPPDDLFHVLHSMSCLSPLWSLKIHPSCDETLSDSVSSLTSEQNFWMIWQESLV